jgi:metal-responsive CopG/Arc/MetJ family transcriptional regulator
MMNTVRLNITLPDNLALKMNSFIKPRQRSKFIADAVQQKILELEGITLQQQLEEGYRERNKESLEITKEFENLDISGWDEY